MRVGLRSLPFRRAPIIQAAVANERVFAFDGLVEGEVDVARAVDERVFAFDDGGSSINIPRACDESVFSFDEPHLGVVDAVKSDARVWTYVEGLPSVGQRDLRIWTYSEAIPVIDGDTATPVDPEPPDDSGDDDDVVVPPQKVPIPFELDLSGIVATPGFSPKMYGLCASGSKVMVVPQGEFPTLPGTAMDYTEVPSGGILSRAQYPLPGTQNFLHPVGMRIPFSGYLHSVQIKSPIRFPHYLRFRVGDSPYSYWVKDTLTIPSSPWTWSWWVTGILVTEAASAYDASRIYASMDRTWEGYYWAHALRAGIGNVKSWALYSMCPSLVVEGPGYQQYAWCFGVYPRFASTSVFRLKVFDTWIELPLASLTKATLQAAIDAVPGVLANGGLQVTDWFMTSGTYSRRPMAEASKIYDKKSRADFYILESYSIITWDAPLPSPYSEGQEGDYYFRLMLTQG